MTIYVVTNDVELTFKSREEFEEWRGYKPCAVITFYKEVIDDVGFHLEEFGDE